MTDRDRYSLRGPVRLCELHRTSYPRSCGPDACETDERNDLTIVEFLSDGLLLRRFHKNPPPHGEWTSIYEYDSDSGHLSTERVDENGRLTSVRCLEYDSARRLSRVIVVDKDGGQFVAETYSYGRDGKMTKVVNIDSHLDTGNCTFGVDGTDAAYGAPGATTITSLYDGNKRPTEHLFHDGQRELVSRIDLRYDDRGNLIEEISTLHKLPAEMAPELNAEQREAMRKFFVFGRRHRYDDQNRRIETSSIVPRDDQDTRTFAYNDHGDVISEISDHAHSEYGLGEKGTFITQPDSTRADRSETKFRYQYDRYGNWIEKIVETSGGPVWSVERRTIHYFDDAAS